MKLLVAATLLSVPAWTGMVISASAASGEAVSLTKATTIAPCRCASSLAAMRSGLRPDCEIAINGMPRKCGDEAR